jgi:hypothetical protein
MDASLHFNNPFPSTEASHLIDIPSPSTDSNVAPICVHIREEDSHCEQCRQQVRSMSTSTLQQSSQFALSPISSHHSTDLSSAGADVVRQRRRASHCPSASDPSMGLFSSSPGHSTTSVSAHPWRQSRGLRQNPVAGSQLRGLPVLHSPGNPSSLLHGVLSG